MTQRHYRVFISHSANANEEPQTQAFLDDLYAKLETSAQLEVFLDQRNLKAGDEWCQRLYSWMGLCDAAVILLSPRAIRRENSVWVPRESNLLLWRKAMDNDFIVIPVLVSGLKENEISNNPFIINESLHSIQFAANASDADKIQAIHDELLRHAEAAKSRLVFDPMQVFVEDSINRYAPRQTVEDTLLQHYSNDGWQPYQDAQSNLAVKMVKYAIVAEIDQVIGDVARGSQPDFHLAANLFDALYPMRLPAEMSCNFHTLCKQQVGRGAVVVNSHDSWVIKMMLRAATGKLEDELLRAWRIVELADGWGEDDAAEITQSLAEELANAILGTDGWDMLSDFENPLSALNQQLTEYSQDSGVPILVCARYSPRWQQLATDLTARFSSIVFLLWSGDNLPDTMELQVDDAMPIQPALPLGEDLRWKLDFRRKKRLLGNDS